MVMDFSYQKIDLLIFYTLIIIMNCNIATKLKQTKICRFGANLPNKNVKDTFWGFQIAESLGIASRGKE